MGSTFKINVDGLGFIEAGNKKYKCDKCFEKNK